MSRDWCLFSCDPADYLVDESAIVGMGGAAIVVELEVCEVPLEELVTEATLLRQINHPNLLPLHCSFVVGMQLWMVSPLVRGGSLQSLLRSFYPSGLPEPLIATIARDVLRALDYLHHHCGVMHRDVKAANILMDESGLALLADLGAAARSDPADADDPAAARFTSFVGSPCWMAPEVLEEEGYNWHADIWSFGITLMELALGRPPFYSLPQRELWTALAHGHPPRLEDGGGRAFCKDLKDLVTKCLVREPEARPSAAQLLEHRFFLRFAKTPQYVQQQLMGAVLASSPRFGTDNSSVRSGSSGLTSASSLTTLSATSIGMSLGTTGSGVAVGSGGAKTGYTSAAFAAAYTPQQPDGSSPITPSAAGLGSKTGYGPALDWDTAFDNAARIASGPTSPR
eukprot:scaffold2.g7201.t1